MPKPLIAFLIFGIILNLLSVVLNFAAGQFIWVLINGLCAGFLAFLLVSSTDRKRR